MKIIDSHMHVFETLYSFGANGEMRAVGNGKVRLFNGKELQMIPPGLGDRSFTAETLIDLMDKQGVERGVLLQGSFYGFQNDYTYECARKYPDRFLASGTLDPFCRNATEIADELLNKRLLRAMKFELSSGAGIMSYHRHFAIDGEVLRDVFALIAEKDATLVLDIGSPGMESFQPEAVANVARRWPQMRIVVCHLLAPHAGDLEVLDAALHALKLDNVWFDASALPWNVNPEQYPYPTAISYLALAKKINGAEKILFGTDVPSVLNHSTYTQLCDYVLSKQVFTPREQEKYFYGNALDAYHFS